MKVAEGSTSEAHFVVGWHPVLDAVPVGLVAWSYLRKAASELRAELEFMDVGPTGQHVGGSIDYDQDLGTPPAGGPHNPSLQNRGFYDESLSATRTPCAP